MSRGLGDVYKRQVELVQTEDFKGLPVHEQRMRGGTNALQDQLECPFRAYAQQRLGLRREREPTEFPDALERGLTLHALMQHLTERCATSQENWSLLTQRFITRVRKCSDIA